MTDRAITTRISATGTGPPSIAQATFVLYLIGSAIFGAYAIFARDRFTCRACFQPHGTLATMLARATGELHEQKTLRRDRSRI